jgi:hypothetical protein
MPSYQWVGDYKEQFFHSGGWLYFKPRTSILFFSPHSVPADNATWQLPLMQKKQVCLPLPASSTVTARLGVYTVIFFLFLLHIPHWSTQHTAQFFKENGVFEYLQFSLLCASSLVLLSGMVFCRSAKNLCLLAASLTALAACREMDKNLNELIPFLGWKFAFLFPLTAMIHAWPKRRETMAQFFQFSNTHAFAILWAAFLIVVPLAQLVGDGTFLKSLLHDDYNRVYKRIFEESCEGAGYLVLLFGSIESILVLADENAPCAPEPTALPTTAQPRS